MKMFGYKSKSGWGNVGNEKLETGATLTVENIQEAKKILSEQRGEPPTVGEIDHAIEQMKNPPKETLEELNARRKSLLTEFIKKHEAHLKVWEECNPGFNPPIHWDQKSGQWLWLNREQRRKHKWKMTRTPKENSK